MAETNKLKAKRLEPNFETKRELFLFSGNICAFPECARQIMNQSGDFVGEICHIEAAEEGGERFNAAMTNEERRHVSNLMLMCHDHHVATNNTSEFPVSRLKALKEAHEKKVRDFIQNMTVGVYDLTKTHHPCHAKSLSKLMGPDHWLNEAEMAVTIAEANCFLERLRRVPLPSRQLLAIAVERSKIEGRSLLVVFDELEACCNLSSEDLRKYWMILDGLGFVGSGGESDLGQTLGSVRPLDSGWPLCADLKKFAAEGHATLEELLVNLNFHLLD